MELWDDQMLFQSLINTPVPMANSTGIKDQIRQSDSELDLSSRSSLGILPAELMEGSTDGFFNVQDENQRSAPSSRAEEGGKSSRQDYFCQDSQEGPGRATLKKKIPDVIVKPPREKNLPSHARLLHGMGLDGDADASIHEVQLADDDLKQLDVDFGDLDLDTTVTDEERQQNENESENKQAPRNVLDSMYFRSTPLDGEEDPTRTYNQTVMPEAMGQAFDHIDSMYFRPAPTEGEEETGKSYNQSTMLRDSENHWLDFADAKSSGSNLVWNMTLFVHDPTGPGTCTFNQQTFRNETVSTGLEMYGAQKQKLGYESSADGFGKEDLHYQGNRGIESESTGSDDFRQQMNGIESEIDTEDELDAARRGIGDGTDNENNCLAFKLSLTRAAAEQQLMDDDFGVDNADFFGTDDAKAMLDADEKEFEKENIFSEVENIQPDQGDTSWNVQASLLNCRPSWALNASSDNSDPFRISMFIQERTDALGSLDGNPNVARPEFGLDIVTPPRNRPAKALISPVSGVSEPASNDNTRTSGVGVEGEDDDADSSDTTLSIDALKNTPSADHSSSQSAGASTTLDDTSGMLSISSIVKAITDASKADHKELSELIISLSTMKSQESKAAKSKPEAAEVKKKPRTQSYDRKETKKSLVSKLPIRSNSTSSNTIDKPQNKEKSLVKKNDQSRLFGSSANQNKTFNVNKKSKVEGDLFPSGNIVGTQKSLKTPPIPSSKTEQTVNQGNKPVQPKALKPVKKLLEKPSLKGEITMKSKPDGKESLVTKPQGTRSPPIARATDNNPPTVAHKEEEIPKTPKKLLSNESGMHWDSPRSSLSATYSKEFEAKFRSKQLICQAKTHSSPVRVKQTLSEGADASQRLGLNDYQQQHLDRETTPADGQAAKTADLTGFTVPQQTKSDIDNHASSSIEPEECHNDIPTFQGRNNLTLDQESHSVTDEMKADLTLQSYGLAGAGYNNDFRSRSGHRPNFLHGLEAEYPVTDTPTLLTSKSLLSTDLAKRSENMRQQLQMRHLPYASQGFHLSSAALLEDDTLTNVFKPLSPQRLSLPDDQSRLSMVDTPLHHSADDSCLASYPLSQLEPSENGHRDGFHATAPTGFAKLAVVIAPGEVRFSDVCCLGISTSAVVPLKNPTSRWQECHLKLAHLMRDGKNVDHEMSNPFQIKDRAIIEPNTTDEINMLFIPKSAGVYVVQLQIYCHQFSQTMPSPSHDIPTIVTLQAIAEKPNIQILNDNPSSMDFGQLRWGNSHSLPLQFINRGQAAVPLRLSLSANNASWHCFSFEKEASCNVSTISKSSRPSSTALSKSIINLLLKGTQGGIVPDPVEVMVYCSAPEKQWERGLPPCRPEELTACVNLEVDLPTPTLSPISCVTLRALVGEPRLHIINSAQGVIMKSKLGQAYKESFPMKNVGNIDMPVTLRAADYGDVFLIEPSTVLLKPECNVDVEITFIPKDRSCKMYSTLLLLYIEPSGPLFEVDITGHVMEVPPKPTTKVSLLTDTDDLVFGGVAVGRAESQKVTVIYNSESSDLQKLRVEIRSQSKAFQLQTIRVETEKLCQSREMFVKPKEQFVLNILFAPPTGDKFTGKVVLKPEGAPVKYTVKLSGYGGVSKLVIKDSSCPGNDWLTVGDVTTGNMCAKYVTVENTGMRTAFVKAQYFTDATFVCAMNKSSISVQPGEFILKQGEKMEVMVMIIPGILEAALCKENCSVIACIKFLYGDEIARHRMRRALALPNSKGPRLKESDPMKAINFDVEYSFEETLQDDHRDVSHGDVKAFYRHISYVPFAIFGEKIKPSTMSTPRLQRRGELPTSLLRESAASALPEFSLSPGKLAIEHSTTDEPWDVKPDKLILNACRKGALKITKFEIINYSAHTLSFDIARPAYAVKVTPEQGTLQPRSSINVCVSPSSSLFAEGISLPWLGPLYVNCGGKHKALIVQIHERDDSAHVFANSTLNQPSFYGLLPEGATPLNVPMTRTLPNRIAPYGNVQANLSNLHGNAQANPCLILSTNQLTFPRTDAGMVSESNLEMTNTSIDPVRWVLSSLAPAYVMSAQDNKTVSRSSYSVFRFNKTVGCLASKESTKIPVRFQPLEPGTFTQYWDILVTEQEVATRSHTISIMVTGQASPGSTTIHNIPSVPVTVGARKPATELSDEQMVILKTEKVDFPSCRVNHIVTEKITLKNTSLQSQTVEVLQAEVPFYCKTVPFTINPKCFVRVRVEFRPKISGNFHGLLVFRLKSGHCLSLPLTGCCL